MFIYIKQIMSYIHIVMDKQVSAMQYEN